MIRRTGAVQQEYEKQLLNAYITEKEELNSAYNEGNCCTRNDTIYHSLIDNNTWALSAYPQGWEEVQQV